MKALNIKQLTKRYGKTVAVDGLNLTVERGEFFGLLGHNGAGKSTTINCITGIAQFTEGSITIMDHDVRDDYQEARAKIGLSPQEFNADIFIPIEFMLEVVGGYFGMNKSEIDERREMLLKQFNLTELRKRPFGKLSGGQKRRAILARAMMHDPDVLILDEPTAGIDVEQRRALWNDLRRLHKDGKTIILTSHYLEEVEQLCSRVAIMHKGKILKELTKDQFAQNGSLEETYLSLTKSAV